MARPFFRKFPILSNARRGGDEDNEPIRAELFSVERLEQYARELAAEHSEVSNPRRFPKLLPRLEDNADVLIAAYNSLTDVISKDRAISPAAEWLVDNFHIVEEQLREIREDLPKGYYRQLPKLVNGQFAGFPRIYAAANEIIAHTDSRLESETLDRFLQAYQSVTPLTIGELWAVAITLRLGLVENLRRLATRVVTSLNERGAADEFADELMELASKQPDAIGPYIASRLGREKKLGQSFIAQLVRQLRDQDFAVSPASEWLEARLQKSGETTESIVQIELQSQASAQVTVGNIIHSMRLLSTLDWRDYFERVSLIDPLLISEPAGVYAGMNFLTRDRYREVIERIARQTKTDELVVGERAVELAQRAYQADAADIRRSHVGYYLTGEGTGEFETQFGYRPRFSEYLKRLVLAHPSVIYLGSLLTLTTLIVALLVWTASMYGAGMWLLIAFALLSIVPASDLAVSFLNWIFTLFIPPRQLPQMDTSDGVPESARTMVVVPTLLVDEAAVSELLEKLEVDYLANQDPNIYFALLGDHADAAAAELPEDAWVLDAAHAGIEELNAKHGDNRFSLFHRRRLWNPGESKWMGWERKRGKLEEFNRLLRSAGDTSFVIATADRDLLSTIRFVITLDTDSQLPRDAARKLIGVATHPLNRPQFDPISQRVTRGYGILQPRVSISLTSAGRSRFASLFSGNTGFDPYTTASSDVYQDLFGEGSFTGKGLYDVDAFETAVGGRVAENTLLSHDLFEGLFARCGLVTDIEVIDDFPTHYDTFALRAHRWVRGDWQIARWIFPWVLDAGGKTTRNPLPLISRWKILDNLRRSLVPVTMFLWLIAVWTFVPGSPYLWTLFILIALAFPIYTHLTTNIMAHPKGGSWASHLRGIWDDAGTHTAQTLVFIVSIAHRAYLDTDAIIRTLYRQFISRKHLLEWTTAAQAEKENPHSQASFFRFMWAAPVLAVADFALVGWFRPEALPVAGPFLLSWFLSPVITYLISRRTPAIERELSPDEERAARIIARRTWRFFETFVGEEDNWLPPDNFQEDPVPKVEHRTSPTNIGMFLLATVSANDLGYIGTRELTERLGFTFATLDKLTKFRGHFLNWYDTRTLETLSPRYISTVDSGNLAGHLIAVEQAINSLPGRTMFDQRTLDGLEDTLVMMNDEARQLGAAHRRTEAVTVQQLSAEIEACSRKVSERVKDTPGSWLALMSEVIARSESISDITEALSQEFGNEHFEELRYWSAELLRQARTFRRDIETFLPWNEADVSHMASVLNDAPPEIRDDWRAVSDLLNLLPPLSQLPELYDALLLRLHSIHEAIMRSELAETDSRAAENGLQILMASVKEGASAASDLLTELSSLSAACAEIAEQMDFGFLLDPQRKVFAIGYSVDNEKLDNSYYDLLASEARLASFVAIAKGDAPQEHWFRLGRSLTPVSSSRALISWTATMFEYLMPLLVMRNFEGTLLDQTYRAVVARQIEYGAKNGVPWGISESAYNARDLQFNYQYGAFGVPGLGLKRGLSEDLVITPYATALAALISPHEAMRNFASLAAEGGSARYGFYEAIDYTPERLRAGQKHAVIRAYMAHHQGMILVALAELVNKNIMQGRFHAEPMVRATELLLQERIPKAVAARHPRAEEVLSGRVVRSMAGRLTRVFDTPHLPTPRTQILSNGKYSVMVTTSGAGYSTCEGMAVTRWREDATRDPWGSFIYLRDTGRNSVWSSGYHPAGVDAGSYEVSFSEDKAVIKRRDGRIATQTEIIVSPEDNAELRRISITNRSAEVRDIEVTSYAEVVLAPREADTAHPAFSNLFIETEFYSGEDSLIASRRPRSEKDRPVWAVHTVATDAETVGATQYETDRSRFLGHGHDVTDPVAIMEDRPLSNTVGAVLDPIFSLRRTVRIQPHRTAEICFSTAIANDYEEALRLADKYHGPNIFEREAALAWTKSQVEMRHLGIEPEDAYLFQRLASRILYSDPSLRPGPHVLALNSKTQADLWPYGISGDTPIVLVRIDQHEGIPSVQQLLKAHEYLRMKGLVFDLVILNEHPAGYMQPLQDELLRVVRISGESHLLDKNGGIFLKRADQMSEPDRILLHTVARAVIVPERGTIEELLVRRPVDPDLTTDLVAMSPSRSYSEPVTPMPDLSFFNGLGGFSGEGREYVIILGEGQWTPAPWLNVIANERAFGFQVSETGAGFTWSRNSRENRLTPWSNDAVSDPPGEVIYLRDEESGSTWSPTPLPIREPEPYKIKHGQGYSVFEHTSHGIEQSLLLFVPVDAPVKISVLNLHNKTEHKRRLSVIDYNELVMGTTRERSAPFIVTEADAADRTIFARNPYNNEFANSVVFVATDAEVTSFTCDRKAFLGRNGTLRRPAAIRRSKLSPRSGAGLDPCAAFQSVIELEPGETRRIVMLLGEAASQEEARELISRFRQPDIVQAAFDEVLKQWNEVLGVIEVRTPDTALNTIVNRWLPYQTLACRVWARSAFYQSGGAYGFRDQLQDVMALVYSKPRIAREQILRAAARQFKEGDVQHWWHPPTGRGVRTRFSDDLLWLPFVVSFYVRTTGDSSILDEVVPFIESPPLADGEDEAYILPVVSQEKASVYEHCVRAMDRSMNVGAHGIPLMGSGDWNDGMNSVGDEGTGESVWLGWFLLNTLSDFVPFCQSRHDKARTAKYLTHIDELKVALNTTAWDGDWFRRAYFDDGTPLGSAENDECRIDSIAQSWSVISGGGDQHQSARAMASVDEYLIRRGDGIVLLFTPPFDKGELEPGYIKGYLPGVRENGGQYTHAALWTLIAFAMLGDGDRAGELFSLLNPINHASTRAGLHRYKVEPYVAAADVYAQPQHVGRGGWTWYTGSASWMYRAAVESMLGFQLNGDKLKIDPCIPRDWREFDITYRRGATVYKILVENPTSVCRGVAEVRLDGVPLDSNEIPLSADGAEHEVTVLLGG